MLRPTHTNYPWKFFFLIAASLYVLTLGVECCCCKISTQGHTQSVELLWTRDRPVAETSA